jgi:hypothetical protein
VLDNEGLLYARCIPINVFNNEVEGQPQLLQDHAAAAVIDSLNVISRHLNQGEDIISTDGFIVPINEVAPATNDSSVTEMSPKEGGN